MALGHLVKFPSAAGIDLDGILYRAGSSWKTVIHVHGSFGNFYSAPFIPVMADVFVRAGINFLSFNTSGHDGIAEGYRKGVFEYVGGALTPVEECVNDIKGAIEYVGTFSKYTVLQGHSLGCDRVLMTLIEGQVSNDFVLLAPCDCYQLQSNWIGPETVEHQLNRLKSSNSLGLLVPSTEYGLRQGPEWTYEIPISNKALTAMMEGAGFRNIRLGNPEEFFIESRCLVAIGENDRLQTAPPDAMFSHFEQRVRSVTRLPVKDTDHMFVGKEQWLAEKIANWTLRPE